MTKLLSEVCRILDFPLDFYDIAMKEADNKEKLRGTYMFVNGTLEYIQGFNWENNYIYTPSPNGNTKEITIETLDPWVPRAGIYILAKNTVFLQKYTQKQWQKSFNPQHYNFKNEYSITKNTYREMSKVDPVVMARIKNDLWYYISRIGTFQGDVLTIGDNKYYQEALDFSERNNLGWTIKHQ